MKRDVEATADMLYISNSVIAPENRARNGTPGRREIVQDICQKARWFWNWMDWLERVGSEASSQCIASCLSKTSCTFTRSLETLVGERELVQICISSFPYKMFIVISTNTLPGRKKNRIHLSSEQTFSKHEKHQRRLPILSTSSSMIKPPRPSSSIHLY